MPGFDRPGLVADLADRIGTDVEVDNDVNLAAVAERRHGNAANVDSFAVLWLGEGLGLAIDLGGRLLRGARGGAGEIGYMPLFDPSRSSAAPGATPPSDLQDLIGGDAVLALAVRYGHDGRTPERAVAAAVGDPAFLAALADRVAVGLAPVVAVLDPQLVVLAGPVAKAGGVALRDAVVAAMRRVAPLETTVEVTTVDDDPVLLGGLDAGLAAVRGRLLATLQRPAA
jgi:predicted NBD/HSP70 family sugar kinase